MWMYLRRILADKYKIGEGRRSGLREKAAKLACWSNLKNSY